MTGTGAGLRIRRASKRYGAVTALAGVDLDVPPGALLTVLGPSGCGKTTLLRCIAGLERLDGGSIEVGSRLVAGPGTHLPAHRRQVAVVPQEGALFPHLSVADNVAFGLSRRDGRQERVDEVLALVGLAGYQRRMPHQLSGGQQQRVALARALAPRPSVIMLDEPFSALDAGLRGELRHDVRAALRADGATAVLVTHDQDEALSIADVVGVMRDGSCVQAGPPEQVYRDPADPWVAGFLGEAMLLPGRLDGGAARTAVGAAPLSPASRARLGRPDHPLQVLLRPEQLRAVPSGSGPRGRVLHREFHGHDTLWLLALDDGTEVRVRSLGETVLAPGSEVRLEITGGVTAWPS